MKANIDKAEGALASTIRFTYSVRSILQFAFERYVLATLEQKEVLQLCRASFVLLGLNSIEYQFVVLPVLLLV
ncbi:hypothetical protein AKJ16_DCAP24157 [Drosera capensis]